MNFRLIIDDALDSFKNMAIDEAIARAVSENLSLPTLRFYRWKPSTLSLGYFQKYEKEVNSDGLIKWNLGIVRRITGGKAVLHDDEVTYSFCIPASSPFFKEDVISSYKIVAQALAAGLKNMNIDAQINKLNGNGDLKPSSVCFETPSIYEITVNGKKIIGSAQKRFQNGFLQHGSIPLTFNVDKLFDCFKFPSDEVKLKMKGLFKSKATAIFDEIDQKLTTDQIIDFFVSGFEKTLNIEFIKSSLTEYEIDLVEKELYKKYSSTDWLKKI
jgi:lipoate-protein ligase A